MGEKVSLWSVKFLAKAIEISFAMKKIVVFRLFTAQNLLSLKLTLETNQYHKRSSTSSLCVQVVASSEPKLC